MKWDRLGSYAIMREDRLFSICCYRVGEQTSVLQLIDEKTKTVIGIERDLPSNDSTAMRAAVARLKEQASA